MTIYAPMTADLVKSNSPHELLPGEVYIVRFKNSCREYKTDIWIGVILTEADGPGRNLHGRAKGAKPIEGVWATPLNERTYPVYMPARNNYRWVPVGDIFNLQEKVPRIFCQRSDHKDAALFRRLQQIALQKPEYIFWQKMSEEELHVKGKRSRELELIIPKGYDDIEDGTYEKLEDDSMNGPAELDGGPIFLPHHQVQATMPSFSASRAGSTPYVARRREDSGRGGPLANEAWASRDQMSIRRLTFPGEISSSSTHIHERGQGEPSSSAAAIPRLAEWYIPPALSRQKTISPQPWSADSEEAVIKAALESKPSTIQSNMSESSYKKLTISQAIEDILLSKPEAAEMLGLFIDILSVQDLAESEKLRCFLETGEFDPRLIQVLNPAASNTNNATSEAGTQEDRTEILVGDYIGLGCLYQLEGIRDSNALRKEIVSLGHLYIFASHFHQPKLIRLITNKLQVAWNSYQGVYQLEPLLDVAMMACRDVTFSPSAKKDHLQDWLMNFIADTMDLFQYACNDKHWHVMRELPALHNAVIELRRQLVTSSPQKYIDLRVLLRSRGILEI